MRQRSYLSIFITVFAVAGFAVSAAGEIKLTYANFPPPQTFPCVQMERWAKEVAMRTGGQVKVQTFPGGTLLPAKNTFDGVISGTADIGCLAMSYQPGRFPLSEAIDLPLGFTSAKGASLALYDLIEKYKPKEFEKVKIITLFTCPPNDLMTSKPVRSLAGLKGMELRVSGTGAEVIKRLGGIPVAMPMSDTPEAIQKGIVKGIVSSLETLQDFNYAAYCPFATEANLFVVSFAVVMNQQKWDSLPAPVKKVIDDLRREQAEWTGNYVDHHVKEALTWAKGKYGHQVFSLSAKDQGEIQRLVQPMIDGYISRVTAQGIPAMRILDDIQGLRKKYEVRSR